MSSPSSSIVQPSLRTAFLAWLCPGLGHFVQGRTLKGLIYAVCILGLFFTGWLLGDGKIVYFRWLNPMKNAEEFRFSYLCQFFTGLAALPALIQATLNHYGLEPILGGLMSEPPKAVLNGLHPRLGKLVEVGTVYTMVAGLLNILAIYDAYEGPAYGNEANPAAAETEPMTTSIGGEGREALEVQAG